MNNYIIGHGILGWHRYERQTDRYGSVHLHLGLDVFDGSPSAADYVKFPDCLDGQRGRLFAVVTESRKSTHCGDTARGLAPSQPREGDVVDLGFGTVFLDTCVDGRFPKQEEIPVSTIGLLPDDGRKHDWLNPHSLCRLHEQTVELHFQPESAQSDPAKSIGT